MKRTILLTIMAMNLALGTSRANTQTAADKPEHHSLAMGIQAGGQGVIAGNDQDEQKPTRLDLPGNADREKPLLLMAHCPGGCGIPGPSFSPWQQFQLVVSVLHWI